jgi:hypothetical protein
MTSEETEKLSREQARSTARVLMAVDERRAARKATNNQGKSDDMSEVRDTATVHVSEPVSGMRKSRGKDKGQRTNAGVTTVRVHPLVWAAAKRLQKSGGYARIQIVDEGTVVVK